MKYQRICVYCEKPFETDLRHARVCKKCKEKNHQKKIKKTLFKGKAHLF